MITVQAASRERKRFFRAIQNEIVHTRQKYGRLLFDTLYLGGGTPSLLSTPEITELVATLKGSFDFKSGFEFTCEFNPGDADQRKIEVFQNLGINRISLGVQAFQEHLLEASGRTHCVRDIDQTFRAIHEAGIPNISFDLILGLPGQRLQDFRVSLEKAVQLEPQQFSLYDLEIHEKTLWGDRRKKGEVNLQTEEQREAFFSLAYDLLPKEGYEAYEIATFAKPGFESRHNLIYWNNEEYLGLGPGAYSYLLGMRSQFAPSVGRYIAKCESGDWMPDECNRLSEREIEMETLITHLRLKNGMDLGRLNCIREEIESRLTEAEGADLIERRKDRITLTRRGRFLPESTFRLLMGS